MDIETSEAIEGLRAEMAELRAEMAAVRAEMRTLRIELRAELGEGLAESRRHSDILTESVRDDIRIVAEGLVSLMAKVDALGGPGGRA